jgi:WD40 repeat protein
MTEERRARVRALFDVAAELPAGQRPTFLDAACAGDPDLRAEVEALLAFDAGPLGGATKLDFLQSPLLRPPGPGTGPAAPALPPRIGRYGVLRLLGEGGMGAVYEAEQDNPRRTVALKVIRPGLVSPALLGRFAQEAQILGSLHHPGIAQIYEAGVAEDGQPFFALELIRGAALDEYVRLRGLTALARLELLARVCDAVQHAHEKGVIHRDLKPSNILVDETGQPKVLDFGVARAAGADLVSSAARTRTGNLVGTLSYMSPEQVAADPKLDGRSDVYALGVILYELLAHRLPYNLDGLPLPEAARVIREQDPSRLGSLDGHLRGDVETIVAKALEKDRSRRYASAGDLAADIRRHLNHEPIRARPASALYHLRKFARRHKALVGGVAATGVALVLGLVGTILFAVAEARQRGQAEQNARVADDKQREAAFQTYRARIAAAVAVLSAHDVADAARHLKESPEDLRDWEWRHLRSRLDDSSLTIPLAPGGGGVLLGAPGRLRLAAIISDGLRLTDLERSQSKTIALGPQRRHSVTVAETRRGLRIVTWVGGTAFDFLDEAGKVLCRVEGRKGYVPVVVSPDGRRLAYPQDGSAGPHLVVFDVASGGQRTIRALHRDGIRSFAFSPDGTRIASGGEAEDRTARLWDAASGRLLATCRGHTSRLLSVAFRPDGARFLTTSSDGTVGQWDAVTGRKVEAPYDRHTGEVTAAVYSPDGRYIASAGVDRTVRVWRATGREDVAVLHGHTAGAVVQLAFARGGRRLASLSSQALHWGGDDTLRVWDVGPRATLPVLRGHTRAVNPVAVSPNGRQIASGAWDNTVRLWDAATGEPAATLPHPGIVRTLAYGPDGQCLVTGGDGDGRLRIWDAARARVRKEIQLPTGTIEFVAVRPDGRRLAATAAGLHVYDIASGKRLFSGKGGALAYSPDGRWLAAGDADPKTVLLLDARTHEKAHSLRGHEKTVWSATFSPDSRRLATCSEDRTVRVWQVGALLSPPGEGAEGRKCQVLRGHTDQVYAAAFHPDGTRLATGGRDRGVWLWDLERGEDVARLPGHTSFVWSLAFSPDGKTLVSGSGDTTLRLWDTEPLRRRYRARR